MSSVEHVVKKITPNDYTIFCEEYYSTNPQPLRFGQAFFNRFLKHEDEVENLFFVNDDKAKDIIRRNYINWGEYSYENQADNTSGESN